jgi:Ca-activated chloride channel family protein
LSGIINKVTSTTTLQVYLLDKNRKPTETDVNMTFYDAYNQHMKYDYYQTLDGRGFPDTLVVDPVSNYDIHIHTLPSIVKKNVIIEPDKHNVTEINAAQGFIHFTLQGRLPQQQLADKIKCVVRSGKEIINVQTLNSSERYLAGTYDIEILTLPRIKLDNLKIEANNTTKIEIASPGIVTLQKKYEIIGSILSDNQGKLPQKIYELTTDSKSETIALQPGKYYIIYRPKNAKYMHGTKTLEFEMRSGESVQLLLQ